MAAEEDVLLKEVDEDLQRDETIEFFKEKGPWLAGLAGLVVVAVGGNQAYRGIQANARAEDSRTYLAALDASTEATTAAEARAPLEPQIENLGGGYAALGGMRVAALLAQEGDRPGAISAYREIANRSGLPRRIADLARLRAASLAVDSDAAMAISLAQGIETDALRPYAIEIEALSAMKTGAYAEAVALFRSLEADPLLTPGLRDRVGLILPLALAGEAGVTLEAQASAAEDFINSFSERLAEEQAAEVSGDDLPATQGAPDAAADVTPDTVTEAGSEPVPPTETEDDITTDPEAGEEIPADPPAPN